jgi:hypothetical protein
MSKAITSNSTFINYEHFAQTYLLSAKILLEENVKNRKIIDEKWRIESGLIFITIIYLIRHSIELYLKSISVNQNNNFINIHNLIELKKNIGNDIKIDKKTQNDLQKITEKYTNYNFNLKIINTTDDTNDVFRYPDNKVNTKIIGENLKKLSRKDFLNDINKIKRIFQKISLNNQNIKIIM